MSKTAKTTIWSVVALLLIGVLLYSICILTDNTHTTFLNLNTVSAHYKDSGLYSEGSVKTDAQSIDSIEINWICGSVNVATHSGNEIEISESINDSTASLNSDNSMRYLIKDNELTVQFTKSHSFFERLFSKGESKQLTVLIPESGFNGKEFTVNTATADSVINSVMCEELKIENVSGNIEINNCTSKDKIRIENVSGKVTVNNIQTDKLDISTVSGNVELKAAQSNDADFESVSGKINAEGSFKELDGETVSGSYNIVSSTALDKISFDSVSGKFSLNMPENSGFTVDIDAISGDFNTDFPITSSKGKKIFGDGSADYDFDVVSGDVTINHS